MLTEARHVIPISGKDSLCAALVQRAREPGLPYEYVFCDVRMELPETYAWLAAVENYLKTPIIRVGRSLEAVIADNGMLPSHQVRFCTRLGKIHPLEGYLQDSPAVVQYLGFRVDENRVGAGAFSRPGVTFKYPLVEAGIDLRGVFSILTAQGLLPPSFFWQRLYDYVYDLSGDCTKRWLTESPPWVRHHLFSWRSRSNCFMCFYQRLYEWVGLLEHHPELFVQAERLEEDFGGANADRTKAFCWRADGPLSRVRERSEEIFLKRAWAVHKAAVQKRHRAPDDELDGLGLVSCGAYCGK